LRKEQYAATGCRTYAEASTTFAALVLPAMFAGTVYPHHVSGNGRPGNPHALPSDLISRSGNPGRRIQRVPFILHSSSYRREYNCLKHRHIPCRPKKRLECSDNF
jgi:hypothetical protein